MNDILTLLLHDLSSNQDYPVNPSVTTKQVIGNNGKSLQDTIEDTSEQIDVHDINVLTHINSAHVDPTKLSSIITDVNYDEIHGIMNFIRYDGSSTTIDTHLDKVVTNFTLTNGGTDDPAGSKFLEMQLCNGDKMRIDLSHLIDRFEGSNGDCINVVVDNDINQMSAAINIGSITEQLLSEEVINAIDAKQYNLPIATNRDLGGVIAGNKGGVIVKSDGTLQATNISYGQTPADRSVNMLLSIG